MSGNVASYSWVLNNSEELKHIEDANMLSACISTISEPGEQGVSKGCCKGEEITRSKVKRRKKG
jgi:hypothetical protein